MRSPLTLLAAAILGATAVAQQPAQPPPPPKTLEALIEEITALVHDSKTPGMSLAIATKDEVLFAGGIGLADVEKNIPATADTLFPIGSVTKGFVALAALKLQDAGRLDINATLASIVPELEFKNRWEATDPVRLVHLLEHTSGWDEARPRDWLPAPQAKNLLAVLARNAASRTSRWRPGTRFAYNAIGPTVVAGVVEKITGEAFGEYVRREIFVPVGMQTATFTRPADASALTRLHRRDGVTPVEFVDTALHPAGKAVASARDMAAYVRFHLNRGRVGSTAVLSEAAMERMERAETGTAVRAGLVPGYGLYNNTSLDGSGRAWQGHSGIVSGGRCEMRYLPYAGVGFAVATNADDDQVVRKTVSSLRRFLAVNVPGVAQAPVVRIPDDVAERHTGFFIPVNPYEQMTAIIDRISGVVRMTFDEQGVSWGGVFAQKGRFVGVSPSLLRRENRVPAVMVLLEPTAADDADLAVGTGFSASYRRVPALVAFAPHALLAAAAVLAASTLVLLPVWLVRAWRGRIRWPEHLGLRLWPLAATLAALWFAGAAWLAMYDDTDGAFQRYAYCTGWSFQLAAASLAAALVAWIGLVVVLCAWRRGPHRALYWHAVLVLATLSTLAVYLATYGLIPLVTWT